MPPEQWQRTPTPHLRIIDDETWAKTRERKRAAQQSPEFARRQPTLFSGLLRCGVCGGRYTTYTTGKLICLSRKEGHGCTNRRTPQRAKVEKRILEGLREQMLSPAATEAFVNEYATAAKERVANLNALRAPLLRRLEETDRRITRAIEAVLDGMASDALKQKLTELEQEKADLERRLGEAEQEPEPITFHPTAAKRYAEIVAELEATLPDAARGHTEAERRLKDAVRGLVEKVIITPLTQKRGGEIEITIEGTLQSILAAQDARSVGVVAGGGLEPPTCGL
ncbi:MAG: recombinase zinc beta ribbon domain-containing protein [Alphaproteobacteria bacterium]|nr:recombinase zinc beta ribbon domain-containing protein [Alphaproteobacteria bacterium]